MKVCVCVCEYKRGRENIPHNASLLLGKNTVPPLGIKMTGKYRKKKQVDKQIKIKEKKKL